MDELHASTIFSKLDMQSEYHQLLMAHGEQHKTTFQNHSGHFKYLVMPFGLTDALASFQALMNQVFKHFLQKFVIIFFDDLLVYSHCLEDHYSHIQLILSPRREYLLILIKLLLLPLGHYQKTSSSKRLSRFSWLLLQVCKRFWKNGQAIN